MKIEKNPLKVGTKFNKLTIIESSESILKTKYLTFSRLDNTNMVCDLANGVCMPSTHEQPHHLESTNPPA